MQFLIRTDSARLLGGLVDTLLREWRERDPASGQYVDRQEWIGPDSPHWAGALEAKRRHCEYLIAHHTDWANYMQGQVEVWQRRDIVGLDTPPTGRVRGVRDPFDPVVAAEKARLAAQRAEREARPGKLKLMFYWPSPPKTDLPDAERQAVKAWAKATFPAGRVIVATGYDWDAPPNRRRPWKERADYHVLFVHIDWSYLVAIPAMFAGAVRVTHSTKKIDFEIDANLTRPWVAGATTSPCSTYVFPLMVIMVFSWKVFRNGAVNRWARSTRAEERPVYLRCVRGQKVSVRCHWPTGRPAHWCVPGMVRDWCYNR